MSELILNGPLLPLAMVAIWTPLMVAAMRHRSLRAWWTELPEALVVGLAVGLLALMAILLGPPGLGEGVAWLVRVCSLVGLAGAAYAWPVLALRSDRRTQVSGQPVSPAVGAPARAGRS